MLQIGLLSDTHSYLTSAELQYFNTCDEIWHAGDVGNVEVIENMQQTGKLIRGVYGNIDGSDVKAHFQEVNYWQSGSLHILMTHIGGSPPKYNHHSKQLLQSYKPNVFICGHSHILKVMYDKVHHCWFINPGAAGKHGWHKQRTLIRFKIDGAQLRDMQIIELNK